MIHIGEDRYEYMEEINEGILRQIRGSESSQRLKVLDVGCGSGVLSEAVREKGYFVCGIEKNRQAARIATGRADTVVNTDLCDIENVKEKLGDLMFDILIFSDVLEHLYDPYYILKEYLAFLKRGGRVLISVPNAAVWSNRIRFLFGKFEYSDTGVMDRTHIRFFTFKTASAVVEASGCRIEKKDYTPYFIRAFLPVVKKIVLKSNSAGSNRRGIIDSKAYKLYMKYVYPVEYCLGYLFKPLFAFRIIIVGVKR